MQSRQCFGVETMMSLVFLSDPGLLNVENTKHAHVYVHCMLQRVK